MANQARRTKALERENRRLKNSVADLVIVKAILNDNGCDPRKL